MGKLSAAAFARFLEERADAKDGYIMGAVGQDPKTLSAWYFNQYSGAQYTKAIYWKNHAARVWDCQGLADGYVTKETGAKVNVRARNNYAAWCEPKGAGLIPEASRTEGAAVFWGSAPGSITHVAFLTRPVDASKRGGDWYMVEARGVNYGVVTTRLRARAPKYWGLMTKYFAYDGDGAAKDERAAYTCSGNSVNVREGPGTQYASVGKLKRGQEVNVLDADGWTPVLYDGRARWMSAKYINAPVAGGD